MGKNIRIDFSFAIVVVQCCTDIYKQPITSTSSIAAPASFFLVQGSLGQHVQRTALAALAQRTAQAAPAGMDSSLEGSQL